MKFSNSLVSLPLCLAALSLLPCGWLYQTFGEQPQQTADASSHSRQRRSFFGRSGAYGARGGREKPAAESDDEVSLPSRQPNEPLQIHANFTVEQIAKALMKDYDDHHRPTVAGAATVVEINIYVQSFGSVSVIDMDYTIDILLRQRWVDPRLRFRGYQHTLSMSYLKDHIWIPDLFFRNAKYGFLHSITTPNYLIWLQYDGSITFSQKLTVKLSCPMQLWNFPMDTQVCPVEIGSYGFSLSELEFIWMRNRTAVALNQQMVLNEFERPSVHTGSCQKAYNATGQFTCLFVNFKLVRKFGFYLIYTYLPSVLIVTISWISFWIDYKAVPARITLGLLSVLALMTQSAATMQKLPRVSYIKAIDVWLFACLAFVVGSLLEFALVNMLARRLEQRRLRDELRKMMGREMRMLRGNFIKAAGGNSGNRPPSRQSRNNADGDTATVGTAPAADEAGLQQLPQPEAVRLLPSGQHQQHQQQQLPRKPSGGLRIEANNRRGSDIDKEEEEEEAFKVDRLDGVFVFAYPVCFLAFNMVYWFTYMLWKA